MISLTSGLPGAGKTLWTIVFVEALRKKENRDVYYYGIKDLTLSWKPLEDPKKWFECPPGSIIVIDEAQHHFPMRGSSQAMPEHVKRTATHRHDGHDIFLITQHPGKLDPAMRKDIEVHRHLMRKFGSSLVTVHQWQGVRETCDKTRRDSISHTWRYPKEAFAWYKSAEVHTHKLSIPPKLILAVLFILLVIGSWIWYGKRLQERAKGGDAVELPERAPSQRGGPSTLAREGSSGQAKAVKTTAEYLAEHVPRVPGLEHTAPMYDGLTAPKVVPVPAACIQWTGKGCKCFTQQGTPYKTSEEICVQIVRHGIFLPFEANPVPPQQAKPVLVAGDNKGGPDRPPVGHP